MSRMQLETGSHQDDSAVVAQVLGGDRDAYGLLVNRHSRKLFAVAFRITGSEDDANEVVQDAFLRAYRNLARFERRSNFGTWIYRIAMNCALTKRDERRPGQTLQISDTPEPGEHEVQVESTAAGPEQLAYSAQLKEKVGTAMQQLSKTERAAFVMRHMEGRSIEEIADALGTSANAAKNSIFRAVQKMRQVLEPVVTLR